MVERVAAADQIYTHSWRLTDGEADIKMEQTDGSGQTEKGLGWDTGWGVGVTSRRGRGGKEGRGRVGWREWWGSGRWFTDGNVYHDVDGISPYMVAPGS